jgi:hypothetical protein
LDVLQCFVPDPLNLIFGQGPGAKEVASWGLDVFGRED